MKFALTTLALAVVMTGCGGGDSDDGGGSSQPPAASAAAGFYTATTGQSDAVLAMLDDGTYYLVYADNTGLRGAIVGTADARNGSLTSSNARDIHVGGTTSGTVSGSYIEKKSLNATITYATTPVQTSTFAGTYESAYEQSPSLASLAGAYSGAGLSEAGVESTNITVAASGAVTGSGLGCSLTGTAKTHARGNVYDVQIKFGPSPCLYAGQTFAGIAAYDDNELISVVTNNDRSKGLVFVGAKAPK